MWIQKDKQTSFCLSGTEEIFLQEILEISLALEFREFFLRYVVATTCVAITFTCFNDAALR